METVVKVLITSHFIFHCNGVSLREQLEHIARRFDVDPSHTSVILGAPSLASHLPEAEPILPGHALIRPARGMLKSSIKFPHRDMDNGAGVYGNINNLGIRYDGKQDRVMYTGFRRTPSKDYFVKPNIAIIESEENHMEFPPNKISEMSTYAPTIVVKARDFVDYLLHLYDFGPMKSKFVKNKIGYRKHKYDTNKVLNLLVRNNFTYLEHSHHHYLPKCPLLERARRKKVLEPINKGNHVRANIMRRKVTPFGFTLMDAPDEGEKELKETSYEDSANEESDIFDDKPQENSHEKIDKKKWFWNTKYAYDHIKANPDAPEQTDFMPTNLEENTINWSYYSQGKNNAKEDTIIELI